MQYSVGLPIHQNYSADTLATLKSSLNKAKSHALRWSTSKGLMVPSDDSLSKGSQLSVSPVVKQSAISLLRTHKRRDQMYQNEFLKSKMYNNKRKSIKMPELLQNQSVSSMISYGGSNARNDSKHSRQSRVGTSSVAGRKPGNVTFAPHRTRSRLGTLSITGTRKRLTYAPHRSLSGIGKSSKKGFIRLPSSHRFKSRTYKVPSRTFKNQSHAKISNLQEAIFKMLAEISVHRPSAVGKKKRKHSRDFYKEPADLSAEENQSNSRTKHRYRKRRKITSQTELDIYMSRAKDNADQAIVPTKPTEKKVSIDPNEMIEFFKNIREKAPSRVSSFSSPRQSRPIKQQVNESKFRKGGKLIKKYDAINREILKSMDDPQSIAEFLRNIRKLATKECTLFRKRFQESEKVPNINDPLDVERYVDSVDKMVRKARISIETRLWDKDNISIDLQNIERGSGKIRDLSEFRKGPWKGIDDISLKSTHSPNISNRAALDLYMGHQYIGKATHKYKDRKPLELHHTGRTKSRMPMFEPFYSPQSDLSKDLVPSEQSPIDLVPLHEHIIRMPMEQHYLMKKGDVTLGKPRSANQANREKNKDRESLKEPLLDKGSIQVPHIEKNKDRVALKRQYLEKSSMKEPHTEKKTDLGTLEQAHTDKNKDRFPKKRPYLVKILIKVPYTEKIKDLRISEQAHTEIIKDKVPLKRPHLNKISVKVPYNEKYKDFGTLEQAHTEKYKDKVPMKRPYLDPNFIKVPHAEKIKDLAPAEQDHTEIIKDRVPLKRPQLKESSVKVSHTDKNIDIVPLKETHLYKRSTKVPYTKKNKDRVPLKQTHLDKRSIKVPYMEKYKEFGTLEEDYAEENKDRVFLKRPQLDKSAIKVPYTTKNKERVPLKQTHLDKRSIKVPYMEKYKDFGSLEEDFAEENKDRVFLKRPQLDKSSVKVPHTKKTKDRVLLKETHLDKRSIKVPYMEKYKEFGTLEDDAEENKDSEPVKDALLDESTTKEPRTEINKDLVTTEQVHTEENKDIEPLKEDTDRMLDLVPLGQKIKARTHLGKHFIGKKKNAALVKSHSDKKAHKVSTEEPNIKRNKETVPSYQPLTEKTKQTSPIKLPHLDINPKNYPHTGENRDLEPVEQPPVDPNVDETEVDHDNLSRSKSKYGEFLVVHRKQSVSLLKYDSESFPLVRPITQEELSKLSPEEFLKFFSGVRRGGKSAELLKSALEMVKDNLPLTYKYREELVRRYLYGNDVVLSEFDNISIDDIDLNAFLNYPYSDKYIEEQIEPQILPVTKTATTRKSKMEKPKIIQSGDRKDAVPATPAKVPVKCSICNSIQRNKPIKDDPFMLRMKKDMKRLELKAYIKEKQILHTGTGCVNNHFEFNNQRVLVPCEKPRTVCNHIGSANVFYRNFT